MARITQEQVAARDRVSATRKRYYDLLAQGCPADRAAEIANGRVEGEVQQSEPSGGSGTPQSDSTAAGGAGTGHGGSGKPDAGGEGNAKTVPPETDPNAVDPGAGGADPEAEKLAERAKIEIPSDWATLPWPKRLKLAASVSAAAIHNADDVEKAIKAELARREASATTDGAN
ncbi:hypothetical protein [Microbaculum marinum]|uniref:Terminase small subunit n=1 Tax=Microbaculum marinum TaxID=1764581 RepID=A0AAW9RT33_9HYPH